MGDVVEQLKRRRNASDTVSETSGSGYVSREVYNLALDEAITALQALQREYDLLASAVNDSSGECTDGCDSYGHTDECTTYDMAYILKELKRENERLREALVDIAEGNASPSDHILDSGRPALSDFMWGYSQQRARSALKEDESS